MRGAQSVPFGAPSPSMSGSHASPVPSPSWSACVGFATPGQLSRVSQTPSPSASTSACRHPEAGSQESTVHVLASLQLRADPDLQRPSTHASFAVQASPSLQGAALSRWTHPLAGLHESSVHGFRSSQLSGPPPAHAPSLQASDVVQALASSHDPAFAAWTHPVAGLQESSVQGLLSSHSTGDPAQIPPVQTSFAVQALPSSQGERSAFTGF